MTLSDHHYAAPITRGGRDGTATAVGPTLSSRGQNAAAEGSPAVMRLASEIEKTI